MNDSIRLGRIAGIGVGFNWSLLVVMALIGFSLAGGLLPAAVPGLSGAAAIALGVVGALLFIGSILAHELGHAVVARREGIEVDGITLWLLGGVARLRREPDTPGSEFRIAAAGPAVSVGLAVGFVAAAFGLAALGLGGGVPTLLFWLGLINGVLAVFNLVPASPLDGGRILRAALWARSGDRWRSSITAAKAGQLVGSAMIGLGVWQLFAGAGNGLWTAFLGWFVLSAARQERLHALREQLRERWAARGPMAGWFVAGQPVPAPAPVRVEARRID